MMAHHGPSRLPELEWVRQTFLLNDEQFAKVADLHQAYRPTCDLLCARVAASRGKVMAAATGGNAVSPALKAALEEQAALELECRTAMIRHLQETAACMPPEQGQHFLKTVLSQSLDMPMEPNAAPGAP